MVYSVIVILLLICNAVGFTLFYKTRQAVMVKGQVLCNGSPYKGAQVMLMEDDVFGDDILREMLTGDDGKFDLAAVVWEHSTIEPYIWINHRCNHNGLERRSLGLAIPKKFIFDTHKVSKENAPTYYIGTIHLDSITTFD